MGKKAKSEAPKKKKHHRFKKLVKLAVLAGAAYSAKKIWDQQRGRKKSPK
ncbi:MAG: hypothetical protein HY567_03890 [Candidatus Kerfeldbacteria bacterium]|nr:hypothetical protein [Candidatus Kerfeldbacteria bacterium]